MYEHQGRDTRISYLYSIPMYERTNIKKNCLPTEKMSNSQNIKPNISQDLGQFKKQLQKSDKRNQN